jgi:hypothetical protein
MADRFDDTVLGEAPPSTIAASAMSKGFPTIFPPAVLARAVRRPPFIAPITGVRISSAPIAWLALVSAVSPATTDRWPCPLMTESGDVRER